MQTTVIQLVVIAFVFVVFYFLMIRPQVTKQRQRQKLISEVKKGDSIITIGGIVGAVKEMDKESIIIETGKNVEIKMSRGAVASKIEENKEKK